MNIKEIFAKQKEIVERYYKIENNIALIELFFDTFSELIDNNLGNDSVEKMNGTVFEKIEDAFEILPRKTKIRLIIHIKDLGKYSQQEAERIINENIILKVYNISINTYRRQRTSFFLALAGFVGIGISFLINGHVPEIVNEVVNISGTVLLWEALISLLIERNSDKHNINKYKNKIENIEVKKTQQRKNSQKDKKTN